MKDEDPETREPENLLPSPFESIMSVVVGKSDDPFAPTVSPYVNAVLEATRRLVEEEPCPEGCVESLAGSLASLAAFLQVLSARYFELKRVQDRTPVVERQDALIEGNLTHLAGLTAQLSAAGTQRDKARLTELAKELRAASEALFTSFNALNTDEQRLPQHSRAPYVNELLRIAQGVVRGDFPGEELKERLDRMLLHWEKSYGDFQILKLGKADSLESEESVRRLEEQYGALNKALLTMRDAVERRNMEGLQQGMAALRDSGELMMDFFDYLEKKMQPPSTRTCLRCGAENALDARLCRSCHFEMPDFSAKDTPSSFSFVDSSAGSGPSTLVPMNLLKLQEAVQGVQAGTYTAEDFGKTIAWLEEKVQEGRAQLASLEEPADFGSPEEETRYRETRSLLEGAVADLSGGLAELREYLEDNSAEHLSSGLERCFRGGRKFIELNTLLEEIRGM